ncbi:MAG: helix-turn-helix domain-containing protein [Tannerella sp.]|jgi:transcriptional regulator with XRE-family HTH domain|nr:helix-turn-helix domain-containing protein [Tannerella sp.]
MDYFKQQQILACTSSQLLQHLGVKMKELRVNANITQRELAEKTGIAEMTVTNMERGKNISLSTFLIILRALNEMDAIYKLCFEPLPDDPLLIWEMQRKKIKNKRLRVRK